MHRQSSIYSISKDEVLQLSLLLDSGMDMHTLIQIAFRSSEAILQALNQGESFRSILCKYQRTHFFKLLNRMLESLDLKCAIDCVKNIESVTNDLFQKVLKKSAYPIFLYIFSLIMLIFFSDFVLVQMGEYANGSALLGVLTGLKFVFIFVSFVFCCFLICCVFLYYGKCLWMLRLDIVKKICTLKFVYIFQALIGVSLSTMEALNLMASMEDWLIKFYA